MTDRREQIELTILHCFNAGASSGTTADAVLAALADDLLPEIPEWVEEVTIGLEQPSTGRVVLGAAPTITAAIRNALESV